MSLATAASMPAPASLPVPPPALAASLPMPGERQVSPLMIADHLITLAEHADRAGMQTTASNLVKMVFTVLDEHGVPN